MERRAEFSGAAAAALTELSTLCHSKKKLFMIYGKWTECLWGIDPSSYESFKKHERRGDHQRKARLVSGCSGQTLGGRRLVAGATLLP